MQPDHDEVEIRPYRPGDEAALVALFAEVFGKPCSLEWWRWKLKGQPSPVENVWVATAGERVVGQYAGIPVRVRAGGAVCPAMVSVDTMTSPDFRRRGILSRLGAAVYEAWATAGVVAVIGLPNEQWGSGRGGGGWGGVWDLSWVVFPLHAWS
ncbi:MAG: GNAT family N-acetyltransferase, partial [Chloroflexia bacterium]